MTKCNFCNAELKDNEPICEYCNMYNKEQMLENEKKSKESVPNNQDIEKEIKKSKEQQNTAVIKCLLPASLVLTVGLFFFISSLIPSSSVDEGISFMFGLFGIPIGLISSIVGIFNSIKILNINPQNKEAKNSITMIVVGITALFLSDNFILGISAIIFEIIVYAIIINQK